MDGFKPKFPTTPPVSNFSDVDCKDPQAVASELLIPILNQLSQRTRNVDEFLIGRLNAAGEKLYDEYRAIADALDKILVVAASDDIKRSFHGDIEITYRTKVLNALRTLYKDKYYAVRENSCPEWTAATKLSLKYIFKTIPTKDEIIALLNDGTINPHNAVEFCTDLMRIRIINRFMELDGALADLVHETKAEAVHILADDDKGRLGKIFPLDNLSPEKWIDGFIAKTDCEKNYPLIAKALSALKNFTINVQGFLIYEIRNNLDVIDFSLQPKTPEISTVFGENDLIADEIITWLRVYVEKVHDGIDLTLKKLNSVPNKARFAALKDFYDRATYAGRGEPESVLDQWNFLYQTWTSIIWADKYRSRLSLKGQAQAWDDMIAQFKAQNKKELFTVQ